MADWRCGYAPVPNEDLAVAGLNRTSIIVAALGLIGVIGAAVIASRSTGGDQAKAATTTTQTATGTGNTLIAGSNNIVNPTPVPKACRDKSHGVERYGRTFNVNKDSPWMGGGFDPTRWCDQAIAQLARENPDGAFAVVGKSENKRGTCQPFNCPQYQYHCAITVQADPVYIERISSACK
jgi:hypothetical protein